MWIERGHPIVNVHAIIVPTRVFITTHINNYFFISYSVDRFIPSLWRSEGVTPQYRCGEGRGDPPSTNVAREWLTHQYQCFEGRGGPSTNVAREGVTHQYQCCEGRGGPSSNVAREGVSPVPYQCGEGRGDSQYTV